jgi:Tetratricopeptide repeat
VLGARDPGTLETRHWLGVVSARTGNLPEAIRLLEESAEGRRSLGQPTAGLAGTLDVLTELYAKSGLTDSALQAREESVAVNEEIFGPGDTRVITARDELAEQYLRTRRAKKATSLLKRNLAAAERSYGPDAEVTRLAGQRLQHAQRQAKKPRPQGE